MIEVNYNEYKKTIAQNMKLVVVNHDLKQEIERLNNILDTLMQDMALLNATGVKEIRPKYVFDRIVMLRERES